MEIQQIKYRMTNEIVSVYPKGCLARHPAFCQVRIRDTGKNERDMSSVFMNLIISSGWEKYK